ncbi:hypothetical protein [Streptomyces sp. NPDC004284]|uniref:hypothetical protein n=1 Tax=Streptomyces sp. NPDC004284 TaxID=3364695 RepID=UPI00368CE6E7
MEERAAEFVERVGARLPLDHSVGSLRVADRIADWLWRGGAEREAVAGTLLGLGAYVGEVLVREAGAVWVDPPDGHLMRSVFAHPVAVWMPDGRVWNPLGRTMNRFEIGPNESLHLCFLTLHGRWTDREPGTGRRGSCRTQPRIPGTGRWPSRSGRVGPKPTPRPRGLRP